jgi:hypothetical protein
MQQPKGQRQEQAQQALSNRHSSEPSANSFIPSRQSTFLISIIISIFNYTFLRATEKKNGR